MTSPRYEPRPEPRPESRPSQAVDIVVDADPLAPVTYGAPAELNTTAGPGFQSRPHAVGRVLDRVLSVQRPIVLGHIRRLRARHPEASPAELISLLERHYLVSVMAGGAGVGATAAIPGVGTVSALAISSAETVGFLEATALFGHAVAEVHGIVLVDRDRTHALILALMLGEEGASLLRQLTGQVAGGAVRTAFWGDIISKSMPKNLVSPAVDQLRALFLKKLAKKGTASVIGKVIPYGVGAVIGGTGNRVLGGRIVKNARRMFGPAPLAFPAELAPVIKQPKAPKAPKEPKAPKTPKAPKPPKLSRSARAEAKALAKAEAQAEALAQAQAKARNQLGQ